MLEVIQYLFATTKDENLYFNQEQLVYDLLFEEEFSVIEVQQALDWFIPIVEYKDFAETGTSLNISYLDKPTLKKEIIKEVFACERKKLIDIAKREIILDRLNELAVNTDEITTEDTLKVLDGLIYHLNTYKFNLIVSEYSNSPLMWSNNFTLH